MRFENGEVLALLHFAIQSCIAAACMGDVAHYVDSQIATVLQTWPNPTSEIIALKLSLHVRGSMVARMIQDRLRTANECSVQHNIMHTES